VGKVKLHSQVHLRGLIPSVIDITDVNWATPGSSTCWCWKPLQAAHAFYFAVTR
jgi:hypothetical protein